MVETGLMQVLKNKKDILKGKKLGLLCHPASINENYEHAVNLFYDDADIELVKIFSPQHGYMGEKQDNMIESDHIIDPKTGLAVYSLYSETRKPTEEMLEGVDALVVDLQDVGTRVYTFIYTMALTMEACSEQSIEVIVLDRPNPINASQVEGNILDLNLKSFVGLYPIPMRHGMTIAELAKLFNSEYSIHCNLTVVEMKGYNRKVLFHQTDLPWVYPSPNMPTEETAVVYPGMVLFEGTMVSEGRGTTKPFELIGADYIDPYKLVKELKAFDLAGVHFRPVYFEPTFHKFHGKVCGGVQIHVTNIEDFKPYLTALALIAAIKQLYPDNFEWKQPPYEYEYEKLPIDLLIGDQKIRKKLDSVKKINELEENWNPTLKKFLEIRNNYLIYSL